MADDFTCTCNGNSCTCSRYNNGRPFNVGTRGLDGLWIGLILPCSDSMSKAMATPPNALGVTGKCLRVKSRILRPTVQGFLC